MKLFLHAGLNKTGTSSLQMLFQANQAHLAASGISYFAGQEIAGNAGALSYALRAEDTKTLQNTLKRHRDAATQQGCGAALMSSELVYHDLIVPARRAMLLAQIKAAGFEAPQILLVFREPVSHAISTYCHRSGIRDLGSFEAWVTAQYEFPAELKRFLVTYEDSPEGMFCLRPYARDTLVFDTCAWLGISELPQALSGDINSSVNTAEAALLTWLRGENPKAAARLRAGLKTLPREAKSSDKAVRAQWKATAEQALAQINPDLAHLSTLLEAPMTVDTAEPLMPNHNLGPDLGFETTLSAQQLKVMVQALKLPPWRDRATHFAKRLLGKGARSLSTMMRGGR